MGSDAPELEKPAARLEACGPVRPSSQLVLKRISPTRAVVVTMCIIFLAEYVVMAFLPLLRIRSNSMFEALVDSGMLTGLSAPLLFAFLFRPMARHVTAYSAELERRTRSAEETLDELKTYQAALDTHAIVAVTDSRGIITYANERFCQISKYSREELLGVSHKLVNSGKHPKQFWRDMWGTISSGRIWNAEVCNRAKDGTLYWVDTTVLPIRGADGRPGRYVAIRTDMTQRKLLEQELRSAARTDKLTGLANRAILAERLEQAILRAKRVKDYKYAVLFLDFDRFKLINDSLGHEVGDELLRQISQRLRQALRAGDSVSRHGRVPGYEDFEDAIEPSSNEAVRLGGDEFVVLLDGIRNFADASIVADRLLQNLSMPYRIAEHDVVSTASIGIYTSDIGARSAEEALRDADTAMYEAKLAGKGRCVLFDASMHRRVQERLAIETELRHAIGAGELSIVYQPIVALESGRPVTFEALVRWNHPTRGTISPGEFIPVAEESGLIIPLGEWVLREACRQFAAWRAELGEHAPREISVNLSRKQLVLNNLTTTIGAILQETGVEPSSLHLEITEGSVMQDPKLIIQALGTLKAMGVKLDMDDFGTGHSSLACLHDFPLDVLKIDRAFIANIGRARDFAALVQAITMLARNLGIAVVAEGIETSEQLVVLQSLDCQFGQGYLFGKPMPPEEVAAFCRRPPNGAGSCAAA